MQGWTGLSRLVVCSICLGKQKHGLYWVNTHSSTSASQVVNTTSEQVGDISTHGWTKFYWVHGLRKKIFLLDIKL